MWADHLEPTFPNLCSIDAFRAFVDRKIPVPLLTSADYAKLGAEDRFEYDLYRASWMVNELRLVTGQWERADAIVYRQTLINPQRSSGRESTVVTAPPTGGKTELGKHVARRVELRAQKARPDYRQRQEVPVVWVDVPANANAKTLLQSIALFFLPLSALGKTATELQRQVVDLTTRHRTALIVLDEAQNLTGRRGMGRTEATDMIKLIQNQTSSTVMLLGVDLDSADFLGNPHGRQILDRADIIRIPPGDRSTGKGKSDWGNLVSGFEAQLPLRDGVEDFLLDREEELYIATAGGLGRLARLVYRLVDQVFATSALHPGKPETITVAQFDRVVKPLVAQQRILLPAGKGGT